VSFEDVVIEEEAKEDEQTATVVVLTQMVKKVDNICEHTNIIKSDVEFIKKDGEETKKHTRELMKEVEDIRIQMQKKDQDFEKLRQLSEKKDQELATFRAKPNLKQDKKPTKKETYAKDKDGKFDSEKEIHNNIFVSSTIDYALYLAGDDIKCVVYLDGPGAHTTETFMNAERPQELMVVTPNFSNTCSLLKDIIEEKGYGDNVEVVQKKLGDLLISNYVGKYESFISIWMDTTQTFPSVLNDLEALFTNQQWIPKSGIILAMTWCLQRSPEYSNADKCMEEIKNAVKSRNAAYEALPGYKKYFYQNYGGKIFIIGKLVFLD
jgi:hypothetical protein